MNQIPFSVAAFLGSAELSIEDFYQLQRGDIIVLDQKTSDPLKIRVDEEERFVGRPGSHNSRKVIKIEQSS